MSVLRRLQLGTDKGRHLARVLVDRHIEHSHKTTTQALLDAGFDRADLPLLWGAAIARAEQAAQRIVNDGYAPDAAIGAAFLDGVVVGLASHEALAA